MSGLLFRVDATERVVRSVGDPPNGVVGVVDFYVGEPPEDHDLHDAERLSLVVDPHVVAPPDADPDRGTIVLGTFDRATPISYEDALRACPDVETANMVLSMIVGMAMTAFQIAAQRVDPDHAQAAADAIRRLRDVVTRSVNEGWGPES